MLTFDVKAEDAKNALRGFVGQLDTYVDVGMTQAATPILNEAKRVHKFQSRTGNLISSLRASVRNEVAEFKISDSQAKYGKYIHDGFKSWRSDPFLYGAVIRNEQLLADYIESSIGNLITAEGL